MEENVIQVNGGITTNVVVGVKKRNGYEKDYIWNPSAWSCKNGKNLASIMDDSAITCDEIIKPFDEQAKIIPTNFNEKKSTCKMQNFWNNSKRSFRCS